MDKRVEGIHIRLNRNDYDLLLLSSQYKITPIIKAVIRDYLAGEKTCTVTLPTYQHMKPSYKNLSVRLDENADADIIDFIKDIPKGSKNHIYKTLLRHALEVPDIRQWLSRPEVPKVPKPYIYPKRNKQVEVSVKADVIILENDPEVSSHIPQEGSALDNSDDNIFDLI